MQAKCIEQLENGILLEDRDILVPWYIPLSQLNTLALPFRFSEPNAHEWEWSLDSCVILGGLELSLYKRYSKDSGDEPFTSIGNSILAGGFYETSLSKFRAVNKHLVEIFGQPDLQSKNEKSVWKIKDTTVSLYVWERFDWFCGLQIYIGKFK
ncbi:MAG: hypothetical protein KDD62_06790 [Bdellovibrionales bacterium]|nr:hypothetical protein [Bdellovibrionales bacterium]